jgi:glyoxylase-like metal-dependent hydrolase (beta-lactamase superfamily II)
MKITAYICNTCGVQYEPSIETPIDCKICRDERQYVNANGQSWTSLPSINQRYKNIIEKVRDDLYALYTTPSFGIGQRAHLLLTPHGNILWDCISNIDESTVTIINLLGGIRAIAISHPHYYSTMAEWSQKFGNVPVYIHAKDRDWLTRRDFNLVLWEEEELELWPQLNLINCGGHFDGGTILHHDIEDGKLLVGDVIQVCPDRKSVSFMYSYPNYIPLSKREILKIQELVSPLHYRYMYGAFGHYLNDNAAEVTDYSLKRYLQIYE